MLPIRIGPHWLPTYAGRPEKHGFMSSLASGQLCTVTVLLTAFLTSYSFYSDSLSFERQNGERSNTRI